MSEIPAPNTLGNIKIGVITKLPDLVLHVRAKPSLTARIIGSLYVGEQIQYRPETVGPIDGYKWRYIESLLGWCADILTIQDGERDTPIRSLPVPFRSQLGAQASDFSNDCGAASFLMMYQYGLKYLTGMYAPGITVNDMARDSTLVTKPQGMTTYDLVTLGNQYGMPLAARRPFYPSDIVNEITAGRPVIPLVNYSHILPGDPFKGGHYVTVFAFGERGFWLHDPLRGGANMYISREQLDRAMSDVGGFAAFPYQAVTLALDIFL